MVGIVVRVNISCADSSRIGPCSLPYQNASVQPAVKNVTFRKTGVRYAEERNWPLYLAIHWLRLVPLRQGFPDSFRVLG